MGSEESSVKELSVALHHQVLSSVKALHQGTHTNLFNHVVHYIRLAYRKGKEDGTRR